MGILSFLTIPHSVWPLLCYLPPVTSFISSATSTNKIVEHDVSFNLAIAHSSRSISKRPWSSPRPVPLPTELVLSIIEMAAYNSANLDHSTLLRCALVCRAWSVPAQKLLYTHVTLRTQAACDAFCEATARSTVRGRTLGDAVIRLRIIVDYNQPCGISLTSFARSIPHCPNLYELSLALYGGNAHRQALIDVPEFARIQPSFDDEILDVLRNGPSIAALEFSNWSDNQQVLNQLLRVWKSLKVLTISGVPPLPPPFQEPSTLSLHQLRMNFQKPVALEFVDWLLRDSKDSLHILELEREPSFPFLDHLINSHGPSLHSLSLPSCCTPKQATAIHKCFQLKELRIEYPDSIPILFKHLPDGLQHVALGVHRNTNLQPVVETVRSSNSLIALTVFLYGGGDRHSLLPVLKMACAIQGVDLRIIKDISYFRLVLRGDPIPTSTFPRTQCLDNLYIMRSS